LKRIANHAFVSRDRRLDLRPQIVEDRASVVS
jgi:hypothetical protein